MYFYDKAADRTNLDLPVYRRKAGSRSSRIMSASCFTPDGIMSSVSTTPAGKILFIRVMSFGTRAVDWESLYRGGLPFHATLLEYQGQGIILAAPGGTGKSTCSRRVPPPWRACCDDEVLVVEGPGRPLPGTPFPHLERLLLATGREYLEGGEGPAAWPASSSLSNPWKKTGSFDWEAPRQLCPLLVRQDRRLNE